MSEVKLNIAKDEIVKKMVTEYGYPEQGAEMVAEKLLSCAPEIQEAFAKWWYEGDFDNLKIEGYTVQELMRGYGMNPFAAFLTLDWLKREPARAKAALSKGYDKVR